MRLRFADDRLRYGVDLAEEVQGNPRLILIVLGKPTLFYSLLSIVRTPKLEAKNSHN